MPLPCASQHCPAFTPTIEPFYALLRPLKAIKFLSMQRMNYTEAETGPLLKGGPLRGHKFDINAPPDYQSSNSAPINLAVHELLI